MYCSTCGVAIAEGLSYCNHCGAKLTRNESLSNEAEPRSDWLIFGMLATFVFGTVAIAILTGVMRVILGLPDAHILAFMLLLLSIMVVMEAVFIRLLLRRASGGTSARELARTQVTNELDAAQFGALPGARTSVTEHTTRAFEPVSKQR